MKIQVLSSLLCLVLLGCGGGDGVNRVHVSGTATFDGQPIVYGHVNFMPDAGHTAPPGFAEIIDGKYDTAEVNGRGIVEGPHLVRVTAYPSALPETGEDETAETEEVPPLFVNYELKVDLKAPSYGIDVPAEAAAKGKSLGGRRTAGP